MIKVFKIILAALLMPTLLTAQQRQNDSLQQATLDNCIRYAIEHNPDLANAHLSEQIAEATIKENLAGWLPQISLGYNIQHNFQLPTLNFNGQIIHTGSVNTSGADVGLTQNIFNRDVLIASRTAKDVRLQARQNTNEQNINIVVMVSKAYYNVILTQEQLRVTAQDIDRTRASLKDAYYQYQAGITDKTDYKRATISLNNAIGLQNSNRESLIGKFAYLKAVMGYPPAYGLTLVYDTAQMVRNIYLDTLQNVSYASRIEVQLLQTQKKLQQYNLQYYKWSFLPNVSAFGNYNLNFLNNRFSKLYSQSFPNSYAGLTLSLPIFQGGKRLQQIRQAELEVQQVDNSILSLKNNINSQYAQALSTYKSYLVTYNTQKENVGLAQEVYDVITLQYRAGIKTYLDVITAETDLRTAQINLYNALYQLLSSKIDVAQSLGTITY